MPKKKAKRKVGGNGGGNGKKHKSSTTTTTTTTTTTATRQSKRRKTSRVTGTNISSGSSSSSSTSNIDGDGGGGEFDISNKDGNWLRGAKGNIDWSRFFEYVDNVPKVVFIVWFGSKISNNRLSALNSLVKNLKVPYILITEDNYLLFEN